MQGLDQRDRRDSGQGFERPYQLPLESRRTESVPKFFSARKYLSGDYAAELDDRPESASGSRLRDGGGSGGSPGFFGFGTGPGTGAGAGIGSGLSRDLPGRGNSAGEGRRPGANSYRFDSHIVPVSQSPSPSRFHEEYDEPLNVKLHSSLEFLATLASLAVFGILGVLIRYYLEKLFGPKVAKLTSNDSPLFLDLPANMLGSFFMGWVGVVFKKDIAGFNDPLSVGLSTGLMGCITTYAAMIQRNVALMARGKWVYGFVGILLGMYLSQMSLIVGIDSALLARKFLKRIAPNCFKVSDDQEDEPLDLWAKPVMTTSKPRSVTSLKLRRVAMLVLFLVLAVVLWGAAAALSFHWDKDNTTRRTLWLACVVGPPGVWVRWLFASLNGDVKRLRLWLPLGTLLVNVGASSIEAALSVVELWRATYWWTLYVDAVNLGTMGCLSTVSTFVAEIWTLHENRSKRWRAYFYPLLSILLSLAISIPAYAVPVWVKNYST